MCPQAPSQSHFQPLLLNLVAHLVGLTTTKTVLSDTIAAGTVALLNAIPVVGAVAATGLAAWQIKNLRKFIRLVKQKFEALEQTKLDYNFLSSDEFKALAVQSVEASIKSASDLRCHALSSALLSLATIPTSQFSGKQTLIRVLAQMSDEEMLTLIILNDCSTLFFNSGGSDREDPAVPVEEVAKILKWESLEALVACEGLLQLGLAYDARVGTWMNISSSENQHEVWRITALGSKVVQFAKGALNRGL